MGSRDFFRITTDAVLIAATIAFAVTYCALGFFPGTVLALLPLPWFYLVHSHDDTWRKSIFIITSWLVSIIAFIYIMISSNTFFGGTTSYFSVPNVGDNTIAVQNQEVIRPVMISHVCMLICCIFLELGVTFMTKRTRKEGYHRTV